jgi:hypothetical protein
MIGMLNGTFFGGNSRVMKGDGEGKVNKIRVFYTHV